MHWIFSEIVKINPHYSLTSKNSFSSLLFVLYGENDYQMGIGYMYNLIYDLNN